MNSFSAANLRRAYGTEYKELAKLGAPVLITQAGVIVVNFADTMMVGSHSTEELAAAAFVNSLFVVATVMMIGFAAGMIPLVGALFSRDETLKAGHTLKAGLQVNILVGIIFTLIMGALYFFLDVFGQPEEIMPFVRPYYLTILGSLLLMSVFNTFQQTSNSLNATKMPMWIILGANLLNIFGNWVLIFGKLGFPEMGLTGAGISTLVSRIAGAATIVIVFRRGRRFRPYVEAFAGSGALGKLRVKVFLTSYPIMIQHGIECAFWAFGAIVCGWFGKLQLAAYQVVNTIAQLGFMIYMSVGIATSIRVANANGIDDIGGIRRSASAGLHMTLLLATGASLLFLLCGERLIGFFTPDEGVIAVATTLLFPLVLYQYGDAVQLTYANALRGAGDVTPLLWVSAVAYIAIGVPALLLFACIFDWQTVGVYYSFSVALFSASLLLWLSFRRHVKFLESRF